MLEAYGFSADVADVSPRRIGKAVRRAVDLKPDLLVILAGDGTANLAARLCGPDGPLIAALPGGTMNLLPHALYGAVPWRQALDDALTLGVERSVSGGEIGGFTFYVAAIIGAPALFADAREAFRARKFGLAIARARRALASAFARDLRFSLDGGLEEKAETLMLLCPLVSRVLDEDGVLEAAVVDPKGAIELLRLGFAAAQGRWREDPSVESRTCTWGHAAGRRRLRAVLDGEPQRLEANATFRFTPKAFRALAPPQSPTASAVQREVAAPTPLEALRS
jgi:diacylglycerol kinase family enzyme